MPASSHGVIFDVRLRSVPIMLEYEPALPVGPSGQEDGHSPAGT